MKRLPVIRHIRYWINYWRMERWYTMWRSMGYFDVHRDHDLKVLNAIWRGEL